MPTLVRPFLAACLLSVCLPPNSTEAQTPDAPAAHLSYNTNRLLADPNRSRVYATVTSTNSVIIIDVDTLSIDSTIFAGSNPDGMTISPDGAKMFVADRGATALGVIDLVNKKALTSLTIEVAGSDIEMGLGNRLYVVPAGNSSSNGILQIDAATGATQGRVGTYNVYGGFVEISPDRKTLYYGNEGLSPSTLEKFDVSTATGTMVQESDFGQTGSNGESLRVSHNGQFLCFPNGGGNGGGSSYGTSLIPTTNLNGVLGTFNAGAYPGPLAFTPDDAVVYHAVFSQNQVKIFSTSTFTQLGAINLPESTFEIYDVAIDRFGHYVFVAQDTGLDIYEIASKSTNISTRAQVGTGNDVLIAGFIVTGTTSKKVLLRGLGPTLTSFGISGALADPVLELHASGGSLLEANDNWEDTNAAAIQSTGKAPPNQPESAILITLAPGAYTAILKGSNNSTGVGLIEVYDITPKPTSNLENISTRGVVGTDTNVIIAGFILSQAKTSTAVVVRALGPSLAAFGVSNPLSDPQLTLLDSQGTVVAHNDNWKNTQRSAIETTGLAPSADAESAIFARLSPANYTAVIGGVNNATGVSLVEVYNLP